LTRTPYCGEFVSAAANGAVMAVQFHPEKSQKAGFKLLRNFLAM
jgi:glutamine amidotransferase